jgi:hypothetical protein
MRLTLTGFPTGPDPSGAVAEGGGLLFVSSTPSNTSVGDSGWGPGRTGGEGRAATGEPEHEELRLGTQRGRADKGRVTSIAPSMCAEEGASLINYLEALTGHPPAQLDRDRPPGRGCISNTWIDGEHVQDTGSHPLQEARRAEPAHHPLGAGPPQQRPTGSTSIVLQARGACPAEQSRSGCSLQQDPFLMNALQIVLDYLRKALCAHRRAERSPGGPSALSRRVTGDAASAGE